MKIVADDHIPFLKEYFPSSVDWVLMSGRDIKPADVKEADILLVRSITRVNQALLQGSSVKFVGSVATGTDHLDTTYLDKVGIAWSAAAGCNAQAVVEYVIAVVAALQMQSVLPNKPLRAGVIGVGRIGSAVARLLSVLGVDVLLCDPIRAQREADFKHTPIDALADLDLISIHTPLTRSGEFPTFHLIDKTFLQRQRKGTVLLNAGRGAVVNFSDLETQGEALCWCLDVWEHEPEIESIILDLTTVATPHIAGYSVQSKIRGIEMIYQAALQYGFISPSQLAPVYPRQTISLPQQVVDWRAVVLAVYDPAVTTQEMKQAWVENACGATFDRLRRSFQERHEWAYVDVQGGVIASEDKMILEALGFSRSFN